MGADFSLVHLHSSQQSPEGLLVLGWRDQVSASEPPFRQGLAGRWVLAPWRGQGVRREGARVPGTQTWVGSDRESGCWEGEKSVQVEGSEWRLERVRCVHSGKQGLECLTRGEGPRGEGAPGVPC